MELGQGRVVDVVDAAPMMEVAEAGVEVGGLGEGLLAPRGHKVVESRGILFLQRLTGRGNYCRGIINGC